MLPLMGALLGQSFPCGWTPSFWASGDKVAPADLDDLDPGFAVDSLDAVVEVAGGDDWAAGSFGALLAVGVLGLLPQLERDRAAISAKQAVQLQQPIFRELSNTSAVLTNYRPVVIKLISIPQEFKGFVCFSCVKAMTAKKINKKASIFMKKK